jgi:hypothetical protein
LLLDTAPDCVCSFKIACNICSVIIQNSRRYSMRCALSLARITTVILHRERDMAPEMRCRLG